ncbi:MAG: hypothetical protein ACTTJW_04480 [Sphaerochaeta sp.]
MNRKPGIGKRGTIEFNAKVFHAVQRTTMKLNLLESDKVYEYRERYLKMFCLEENVSLICDVLMANHSHSIVYSENPQSVLNVFKRLNSGLGQFVFKNIVKGTDLENIFTPTFRYHLFSSSVRLFPIEGVIPLFIDTKYLFDNPRHHNCSRYGLSYTHSTFSFMQNGEYGKKELAVFYNLYGMYPKQVMKVIMKSYQDFNDTLQTLSFSIDRKREALVFKSEPLKDWTVSSNKIIDSYKSFDSI